MNWIKFHNTERFELIQEFKYSGPIKGSKHEYWSNIWSNMAFHTIKIKVPCEFDINSIKNKSFEGIIFRSSDGNYYDTKFKVFDVIGLSQTKKYNIYKITVELLDTILVSVSNRRDFAILDLLEDEN